MRDRFLLVKGSTVGATPGVGIESPPVLSWPTTPTAASGLAEAVTVTVATPSVTVTVLSCATVAPSAAVVLVAEEDGAVVVTVEKVEAEGPATLAPPEAAGRPDRVAPPVVAEVPLPLAKSGGADMPVLEPESALAPLTPTAKFPVSS